MNKFAAAVVAMTLALGLGDALAENAPGVTDTEIKIGNTNPYSGPASSYGTIGKSIGACWNMVNDNGGVNGRKIDWISYDDGYSPPKTKEQVRKLVERDEVAFTFQTLGTPTNSAIHQYMNKKKVPHLFVATRRHQMGAAGQVSVDHRLAAELSDRWRHLWQLHSRQLSGRTGRGAQPE